MNKIFTATLFILLTAVGFSQSFNPILLQDIHTNELINYQLFGYSVDVDGDYAIVGAPGSYEYNEGLAYILHYNGSEWEEQQVLSASDGFTGNQFGDKVKINGNFAFVSAPTVSINSYHDGVVYVFFNNGGTWYQYAKLNGGPSLSDEAYFGWSISAYDDFLVISAAYDKDESSGHLRGKVYIYKYITGSWTLQQELLPDPVPSTGNYSLFGNDVDIYGDKLIIGAYDDYTGNGTIDGAVYFYRLQNNTWVKTDKLFMEPYCNEGSITKTHSVAMYGNRAVAGLITDVLVLFDYDGQNWSVNDTITDHLFWNDNVDLNDNYIIATSGDDGQVKIYYYNDDSDSWEFMKEMHNGDPYENNGFGTGACLSGTRFFIGCPYQNQSVGSTVYTTAGALQIFGPEPIEIYMQPSDMLNQTVGDVINFMVGVNNVTAFRWQESSDGGNTFHNLSDGGFYANTTSQSLQVTVDESLDSNYYRVICYNEIDSLVSNSALLTVDHNTGINYILSNNFFVYPIPANDILFVKTPCKGEVVINDVEGKTVMQTGVKTGDNGIDISELSKGFYFLKFTGDNQMTLTKKLIVK